MLGNPAIVQGAWHETNIGRPYRRRRSFCLRGGTVSGESADTSVENRFYVQVAAVGGDRDPEMEWGRLIRKHRADLTAENPIYEVIARKNDQRSFIRILLGPLPDRNAAKQKCASLLGLGMKGCLLRRE
jgi:hypothetical protein